MSEHDKTPPADTPELYPGHAAEVARNERRATAIAEAGRDPLPGPLMDAFTGVPDQVAGLQVRPLVHYDFVILRKLDSPLLRQFNGTDKTPFTDEQGYEMIYQFTRPVRAAADLAAKGREVFQRTAVDEIGMRLGPVEVALLVKAVEREFIRAFSTVIKYQAGAPGPSANGEQVFPQPPADVKTGSAGGSITSAA